MGAPAERQSPVDMSVHGVMEDVDSQATNVGFEDDEHNQHGGRLQGKGLTKKKKKKKVWPPVIGKSRARIVVSIIVALWVLLFIIRNFIWIVVLGFIFRMVRNHSV